MYTQWYKVSLECLRISSKDNFEHQLANTTQDKLLYNHKSKKKNELKVTL